MRVVFMGSADVSCTMLDALLCAPGVAVAGVVTQPDKPSGRHRRNAPCPGKARALAHALPVITPEKVNSADALAQLAAWAPDAIVVVAYGQFLGRHLLALPRHGCINIHLSLLPRHRGAAPVQWAIAAGDTRTGVTAMLMDSGMDSGDILGQVEEPVRDDDTAGTLYARLAVIGARLLARTLNDLAAGRTVRRPQDAAAVTFAPKLHKEDGLIDWRMSAAQIARRVRGFNPWPACFAPLPERLRTPGQLGRLKVLQVEAADASEGDPAPPGTVLGCDPGGPRVQTGEGSLRLVTVQPESGSPMNGGAFLRGHTLQVGDVLGGKMA